MPELIRLYITQVVIGFLISAVVVAGILWFNVANLGHLVTHSDVGLLAVLLLWVFNGIVIASVQFAIVIMGMAEDDDDDDDDGGHFAHDPVLIPVRVAPRR
jgi:hypothetical protein